MLEIVRISQKWFHSEMTAFLSNHLARDDNNNNHSYRTKEEPPFKIISPRSQSAPKTTRSGAPKEVNKVVVAAL